jgi:hypothetical protein
MGCANDPFGTLMPGGAPSPPSIVTSAGGRRALGEGFAAAAPDGPIAGPPERPRPERSGPHSKKIIAD